MINYYLLGYQDGLKKMAFEYDQEDNSYVSDRNRARRYINRASAIAGLGGFSDEVIRTAYHNPGRGLKAGFKKGIYGPIKGIGKGLLWAGATQGLGRLLFD